MALALMLASCLTSCVIIPYRPNAETKHDRTAIASPEFVGLSVGPRKFLGKITKAVVKAEQRVQPVDGQILIDTAAPAGYLTLARLQDPATRPLIAPMQLDYVVLLAEPVEKNLEEWGGMAVWAGFLGLAKSKDSTSYWAAVLDAEQLRVVDQLTSESVGTSGGIGAVYGLFVMSDTSGSARKDVVHHIVETLAAARPAGPVRVAFLAVEPARKVEQLDTTPQWSISGYPRFTAEPPPPAWQALVYVYCPDSSLLGIDKLAVYTGTPDSASYVTRLLSQTYFPIYAPPGDLNLGASGPSIKQPGNPLKLRVAGGQTYYVRGTVAKPADDPGLSLVLTPVDPATALGELEYSHRMPTAWEFDMETRRRADLGDSSAQILMGELYETGVNYAGGLSLPKDPVEAEKWRQMQGPK